jgi:hypothetical protein
MTLRRLRFLTAKRKSLNGKSYAYKLAATANNPVLVSQMLSQASRIGAPAV